jgi:hypothetical protein
MKFAIGRRGSIAPRAEAGAWFSSVRLDPRAPPPLQCPLPVMSPLLVHFLRRIALFALFLAAAALAGPPVLRELGLLGPHADELIAAAERSLVAARRYGADDGMPAVQEANRRLAEARALVQGGDRRRARREAKAAAAQAIVAQRQALARRELDRRRAEVIAGDVDRMLNRLDDLYAQVGPGADQARAGQLRSLLKSGRQTGAALILAFEQKNYPRVIGEAPATRKALEAAMVEMRALGAPRPAPGR